MSERGGWHPAYPNIPMGVLGAEDSEDWKIGFMKKKSLQPFQTLMGEKALGPDDFLIVFWSFSWEFVKEEVMDFFKEFFEQKKFVRSLNATFLVMIP